MVVYRLAGGGATLTVSATDATIAKLPSERDLCEGCLPTLIVVLSGIGAQ